MEAAVTTVPEFPPRLSLLQVYQMYLIWEVRHYILFEMLKSPISRHSTTFRDNKLLAGLYSRLLVHQQQTLRIQHQLQLVIRGLLHHVDAPGRQTLVPLSKVFEAFLLAILLQSPTLLMNWFTSSAFKSNGSFPGPLILVSSSRFLSLPQLLCFIFELGFSTSFTFEPPWWVPKGSCSSRKFENCS